MPMPTGVASHLDTLPDGVKPAAATGVSSHRERRFFEPLLVLVLVLLLVAVAAVVALPLVDQDDSCA
jgi:hypothetical protein